MINIDTVYQTVLRLMNKANDGYLTPKEFNYYARLAQLQLFNKYYGSPNAYPNKQPLPRIAYANTQFISESLEPFIENDETLTLTSGIASTPANKVHVISMTNTYTSGSTTKTVDVRRVEYDRFQNWANDPIDVPDNEFPIYKETSDELVFYPQSLGTVKISYLRKPNDPIWAYTVVSNRPVYDAGNSVDFEFNAEEEPYLVAKIMSLACQEINDVQGVQYAEMKDKE